MLTSTAIPGLSPAHPDVVSEFAANSCTVQFPGGQLMRGVAIYRRTGEDSAVPLAVFSPVDAHEFALELLEVARRCGVPRG